MKIIQFEDYKKNKDKININNIYKLLENLDNEIKTRNFERLFTFIQNNIYSHKFNEDKKQLMYYIGIARKEFENIANLKQDVLMYMLEDNNNISFDILSSISYTLEYFVSYYGLYTFSKYSVNYGLNNKDIKSILMLINKNINYILSVYMNDIKNILISIE